MQKLDASHFGLRHLASEYVTGDMSVMHRYNKTVEPYNLKGPEVYLG